MTRIWGQLHLYLPGSTNNPLKTDQPANDAPANPQGDDSGARLPDTGAKYRWVKSFGGLVLARKNPRAGQAMDTATGTSKGKSRASGSAFPPRDIAPGDLIYGLKEGRTSYLKANPGTEVIDDYRVLQLESFRIPVHRAQEHKLREALQAHPKYKSAVGRQVPESELGRAFTRKCKGGLYWAATVAKKHVHFVLDRLDIPQVVKKCGPRDYPPGKASDTLAPGEVKYRAATGSELRWVYRNRHDAAVQAHIHFWRDGKPCRPPWEEGQVVTVDESRMDAKQGDDIVPETTGHDAAAYWADHYAANDKPAE